MATETTIAKWQAQPSGDTVFFVLATSPKDATKTLKTKDEGAFTWTSMDAASGPGPTSTAPASSTAGTASTKGGGTKQVGLPVILKTIGVLGKTPTKKGAEEGPNDITEKHIVVDPAGLEFITGDLAPINAGLLSEAIYKHYTYTDADGTQNKIKDLYAFPDEVKSGITEEGDAVLYAYNEGAVIHVVGPDFNKYKGLSLDGAVEKLSDAYYNVIFEAETSCKSNEHTKYNSRSVVRLPLISMGQFVGHFKSQKQSLTARAVIAAFNRYKTTNKNKAADLEYWLCLWTDGEDETYKKYASEFQSAAVPPKNG